jgi:hypothetical protein
MACAFVAHARQPAANEPAPASAPSTAPDAAPGQPFDQSAEARDQRGVQTSFQIYGGHVFSHDLDDAGDVSITRAGAKVGLRVPVSDRTSASFSLGAEGSWYDFSDATGFGAGITEPWEDVRLYTFEAAYSARLTDRWTLTVGGAIESGTEEDADFSDSLTYSGFVGGSYSASEDVTIGAGLIFGTRLEDDAFVFPVPIIEWRIDDQWRIGSRPSARGARLAVTYQATEQVGVFGFVGFESREFRLDDEGPAPEGVGRDRRVPVGLGVDWTPHPRVALDVVAGVDVWSQYTLDDVNGDEIGEQDGDPAPFLGAQLTLRF